jgi:hypothetical protein
MTDELIGIQISDDLAKFLGQDELGAAIRDPASAISKLSSMMAGSSSDHALTTAKEFYLLVEMHSSFHRESLAILCSQISVALFNKKYLNDSLKWINKAIEKDNRHLVFFLNKAVILFSLGILSEVISVTGYVRNSRSNFLDFDENIFVQLLSLAATAAEKLENAQLNTLYKQQISSLSLPTVSDQSRHATNDDDPVIYLFACCYNEIEVLPFFLDYYKNFVGVEKFFVFDGGSTDGSLEVLASYNAVVIQENHDTLNDLVLMNFRNNFYKSYRDQCDWVVVCDMDEFLYHPNLKVRLREMSREGVTIPKVAGYSMISLDTPEFENGVYLPNLRKKGRPDPHSANKNLIFNPNIDINYSIGCHHCSPSGNVIFSAEYELKNLHYMSLSFSQLILKSERQRNRLSEWNRVAKAGIHYEHRVKTRLTDYLRDYETAQDVI